MSRGRTRWGGRAQCSQARRSRPPPAAREGQRLRTLSERTMSAATSRSSTTRSEGGLGDREAGSGEGSEGAAARQNKASPRKERGRGQQGPRSAARPRRRPPPPPPHQELGPGGQVAALLCHVCLCAGQALAPAVVQAAASGIVDEQLVRTADLAGRAPRYQCLAQLDAGGPTASCRS
jgi:hypothetical protein